MARPLSRDEHEKVSAAIRAAESATSGEIFCVLARSSGGYFFPAAFFVLSCILAVSLAVAIAVEQAWISVRLPWFVAAQLLAAACALIALWLLPFLRIRLVPHGYRHAQAHDNALRQFLSRNVHRTIARTGVLIFVSLEERYAEVLADSGINEKVPQEAWNTIVEDLLAAAAADRLAEGYVSAIAAVGRLLALHFPPAPVDVNELDDHLAEI